MHVFSQKGKELDVTKPFPPGSQTISFITDNVLNKEQFITEKNSDGTAKTYDPEFSKYIGKTRGEKFKMNVTNIRNRAKNNPPCSQKDGVHWCKDCFNRVASELGENTI